MNRTFFAIIFLLVSVVAVAQQDYASRAKHFNIDRYKVAVQGYDVVSYFEGKPVKGQPAIFYFYKGIRYEFATQAHLQTFKANPEKYEPAYGGWCAYAMAKTGEKVEIDPLHYKITGGKLYLFYYSILNNTLNKWNDDEAGLKPLADKNWQQLIIR